MHLFSFLKQAGVDTLVICAGARNAPLVLALQNENFKIYSYFEERSASFFALGLIKSIKKPVAVITTSGTAAAELLAATIESYYQGLPLILITADRPKSYRGTGSPQTIEQVGLFSNYVESVYDLDVFTQNFSFRWSLKKPLHLNVAYDEPLMDLQSTALIKTSLEIPESSISENIKFSIKGLISPLIILGEIPQQYNNLVVDFILKIKAPVYAETLSQLKHVSEIKNYILESSESLIKQIIKLKLCDSVIRIGGVPTLRFWRDLEYEFKNIPVTNYSDLPFSGLSRESVLIGIDKLEANFEFSTDKLQKIKESDYKLQMAKESLLIKYPMSEQSLTKQLSEVVTTNAVYLGNSLPIRNWDHFANAQSKNVSANRGANGIDGQVSSYLGWSENLKKSFCYVGDLTAMYDLAALGLKSQLNQNQRHIVVLNNFGGQIFRRVFNKKSDKNDNFINAHTTKFYHWAQMWEWNYLQVSDVTDLKKLAALNTPFNIVEVLPEAEQTQLFWDEWEKLCQTL